MAKPRLAATPRTSIATDLISHLTVGMRRVPLNEQIQFVIDEETRAETWASATVGTIHDYHSNRLVVASRTRETLELLQRYEADFVAMVTQKRRLDAKKAER